MVFMRMGGSAFGNPDQALDPGRPQYLNEGKNAVGLTVLENARGGDLTGIDRLNQVDLVKSLRTENPPLHRASG